MIQAVQSLIDRLWDFSDPAASEVRFREAQQEALGRVEDAAARELQTQVARALGLQRRFEEALEVLNAIDAGLNAHSSSAAFAAARARLLLERGRVFNSSNRAAEALPLFERAWEAAHRDPNLDVLAVDAAHMIAIVHHNSSRSDDALNWNRRALEIAEASANPRARQWGPSLHNNIGWTLHARGDFTGALTHFEAALAGRVEQGQPDDIRIAWWSIGKCFRSLGRVDEALRLQQHLLAQCDEAGEATDGYLHEELAECLLALQRPSEAQPHFARAHELLVADAWFAEREPERIARLARLAQQ